jgi:HAD superfamily hydrolase (TIGR01509 family)
MKALTLYFSRSESPELVQVEFSANDSSTLRTVRGQALLDTQHDGTFNWSGAVRALAILIVRAKVYSLDDTALPSRVLTGERGSPATSLDYAISKEPNWLLDMFGFDSKGSSLTKRLFRRVNSGGKRPGPVSVGLNDRFLDCSHISISLDGQIVTEVEELVRLESNLVAQAARTAPSLTTAESRGEVVTLEPRLSSAASHTTSSASSNKLQRHWVIIGGGRIGRGFLNVIADELGFSTTIVVAGRNTPSHLADAYNVRQQQNKGYEVRANGFSKDEYEVVRLSNYRFQLAFRSEQILQRIADPQTQVVSTSVGIERLSEIAPLLAEGIRQRLEQREASPLIVLTCENGKFPDGRSAPKMLQAMILDCLSRHLHPQVAQYVSFPESVLDCAIPSIPTDPSLQLQRGWGQMVLERTTAHEEIFSGSKYIELVQDISSSQVLKLYSFNSLHCYVSIIGSLLGYRFVHEVVGDLRLSPLLEVLTRAIAKAVAAKCSEAVGTFVPSETEILAYCSKALERLAVSSLEYQDPVDRILRRLVDGSYLSDGRIDGPLIALGVDKNPSACPELARILSLSIFLVVSRQAVFSGRFAPRNSYGEIHSDSAQVADIFRSANSDARYRHVLLQQIRQAEGGSLFEVITDDLSYLEERFERSGSGHFDADELLEFFNRELALTAVAFQPVRSQFQLQCAIFDLDEGVINSEALLYRVTREMIEEFRTTSEGVFSHDDYASFVGMSEREFFEREIVPRFQFVLTDPDELIRLREDRYLDLLSRTDRESLCKPGFRATLALLRRCGVRLALYSNASRRRVDYTLNHIELRNYFDIVVSSSDEEMEDKPSPRMLHHVFDRLGVTPQQCLVVESSKIGIEAAKAGGCYCVAMENNYYPRRQETIRRSGIEFLGNGWQLFELIKTLLQRGNSIGDTPRMSEIERSEWLKDVFDANFL